MSVLLAFLSFLVPLCFPPHNPSVAVYSSLKNVHRNWNLLKIQRKERTSR